MSILNDREIPTGLGMALAQDLDAMKVFASLNDSARQQVIDRSRHAKSRQDMVQIVSELRPEHDSFI